MDYNQRIVFMGTPEIAANVLQALIENGTTKQIGIISSVFGIVEFEDRVELVKPEEIHFVDETHAILVGFGKHANINEKEVP